MAFKNPLALKTASCLIKWQEPMLRLILKLVSAPLMADFGLIKSVALKAGSAAFTLVAVGLLHLTT
jgi:hypothetical protein